MKSVFLVVSLVTFLACLFSKPTWSQNAISTGSISGRASDSSGGVVSGATVNLKSADTDLQQSTKTNGLGLYSFQSLAVGSYSLSVSQSGFKTTEVTNVVVQVGQDTAVNVSLQVGSLSESVTVTAEVPLCAPPIRVSAP